MNLSKIIEDFSYNYEEAKNFIESHTGRLTGLGIGLVLGGTVLACRATLKVNMASEEHKKFVDDVKANCAEMQLTPKETRKEVMKAYRHVTASYVRQYWPAVGLIGGGIGLILRAHNIEVAKNEMLMTAYIGLEQFVNKYRKAVADRYGVEAERDIMAEAKERFASEHIIDGKDSVFVNGSYLLFNENCTDYEKNNPYNNEHVIRNGEDELNRRYREGRRVYINEVMRCFGHPEVKNGWKWCWYKYCTGPINFCVDRMHDPEFIRGVCYDNKTEPIAKLMLDGCVHVDRTYEADVRNCDLADGGVMGGTLGVDPVVIG